MNLLCFQYFTRPVQKRNLSSLLWFLFVFNSSDYLLWLLRIISHLMRYLVLYCTSINMCYDRNISTNNLTTNYTLKVILFYKYQSSPGLLW